MVSGHALVEILSDRGGHVASEVVTWPTQRGYHDVVLTVDTDTTWTQRHAGRIATAEQS
ncbi:hypothetical protein [Kutzneria sp. NPDC052558]|uniref:hypothetical protein n=1 Tax=Kutzneria sp. NPDC052558 TaxID=3364121 RepID=UPI0037CAE127